MFAKEKPPREAEAKPYYWTSGGRVVLVVCEELELPAGEFAALHARFVFGDVLQELGVLVAVEVAPADALRNRHPDVPVELGGDADGFALGHQTLGEVHQSLDEGDAVLLLGVFGVEAEDGLHGLGNHLSLTTPRQGAGGVGELDIELVVDVLTLSCLVEEDDDLVGSVHWLKSNR